MPSFLLEVGTEELPASFVDQAIAQWQAEVPKQLQELALPYSSLVVYGTPRRLVLVIENLPECQSDRAVEVKGPALSAAYATGEPTGEPTRALQGFMRSKGLTISDLEQRETDKGIFIYGLQKVTGQPTPSILASAVQGWITGLQGKRLMRWGMGDLRFPRPIRWLVALWQDQVLPVVLPLGGSADFVLRSDRITYGHRVLHPQPVVIHTANDYLKTLAQAGVIAAPDNRESMIIEQISQIEKSISAQVKVMPALLKEVVQLVEYPTAILGDFDEEFLSLPPEVIETEMISHQRYFPVYSADGDRLLPHFITIGNGDPRQSEVIAKGNARVIRARLADGKFFYESDRARPLASFLPELVKVTFQEQLGSVSDKVTRMQRILPVLLSAMPNLALKDQESVAVERAIALCKADLVSQMVKEFPELQGIMGGYYARASGESELVAQAIAEHYQPRPSSLVGRLTAMCDRLDSLVGIFSLGLLPTGSSDPFALRRASASVVQMCWQNGYRLDLPQLLRGVLAIFEQAQNEQLFGQLLGWFGQRCETLLTEQGLAYDLIDALFGQDDRPYTEFALADLVALQQRAEFLHKCRQDGTLAQVYAVVNRAARLGVQLDQSPTIQLEHLIDGAEIALHQALQGLPSTTKSYSEVMTQLLAIAPLLANFFDAVMVMADDRNLRLNRLSLLGLIRNYSRNLADFSCLRSDL